MDILRSPVRVRQPGPGGSFKRTAAPRRVHSPLKTKAPPRRLSSQFRCQIPMPDRDRPVPSDIRMKAELERFYVRFEQELQDSRQLLQPIRSNQIPTPGKIHQLHRSLRRLRLDLGLLGRFAPRLFHSKLQALDEHLQLLSRRVGQVRDVDVMLQLLAELPVVTAEDGRSTVKDLRARLRKTRLPHQDRVLRLARSLESRRTFERLSHLTGLDRRRFRGRFAAALESEIAARRRRVRRAQRRAVRRPSKDRLHQLRKEIRKTRDVLRSLEVEPVGLRPEPSRRLARLQRHLGRVHDLDVLASALEAVGDSVDLRRARRHLHRERRNWAKRVHREIRKRRITRAINRLRGSRR